MIFFLFVLPKNCEIAQLQLNLYVGVCALLWRYYLSIIQNLIEMGLESDQPWVVCMLDYFNARQNYKRLQSIDYRACKRTCLLESPVFLDVVLSLTHVSRSSFEYLNTVSAYLLV